MARIITHAELIAVPDGGVIYLEDGAELTPLARERATARGLRIERGAAPVAAHVGLGGGLGDAAALAAVAEQVAARIGATTPEALEAVTREVVAALGPTGPRPSTPGDVGSPAGGGPAGLPPSVDYCSSYLLSERRRARRRAVLTATGQNRRGIVARITAAIADLGGDILDISQTLVGDYFTMLLIVDLGDLGDSAAGEPSVSFADFQTVIHKVAAELGVQVILMHEDLVSSLHRV
ncbi:MAG: ACT domain-containing protein [Polyangia bacterium]